MSPKVQYIIIHRVAKVEDLTSSKIELYLRQFGTQGTNLNEVLW